MNFEQHASGRTEPRLWTRPLRELTPETSFGYDLIDFAEAIGWPLDPWQRWVAIHMGELLEDGRPRFRKVLILVSRQNGKTVLTRVLILYWMYIERVKVIAATNADRAMAKKSWAEVVDMAMNSELLAEEIGPRSVWRAGGQESFTVGRSSYYFFANNSNAARSLTVDRELIDELRAHKDWEAWNAMIPAMTAVADAQCVMITNQGDMKSVVLDSVHSDALRYIETGEGDPRFGLFEYSAPSGSLPTDVEALAMANPNLGRRILLDSILGDAMSAEAKGGTELAKFRTEQMCMRVHLLDAAIDLDTWLRCGTDEPISMADHRRNVALCLDVSLDATHATLVAACHIDGKTHVEVVKRWVGRFATQEVRRDLPGIAAAVRPRALGWFPGGPTAAIAAAMQRRPGAAPWPPRNVRLEPLTVETKAVCMGLAEQVLSGEVIHPNDPMLTSHVKSTQKLKSGDGFVFTRRGSQPIDASYALAGAVHLARTLPPPLAPLVVAHA